MKKTKNMVKRVWKGIVCTVLAATVTLTGVQLPIGVNSSAGVKSAQAATTSSRVPIVCYPTGSGRVTTYTTDALVRSTGWIAAWDRCTINRLYSNGAVQVTYPVSRGTRTAYAAASAFFGNVDWSTATGYFGVNKTAYAKSTGNTTIGTVYGSDHVCIIARANNRTQVLYPTSSGYKLGWVAGNYEIGGGNSNNNNNNSNNNSNNGNNATVSLNVPTYRQYDANWKNVYIGTKTIGAIGCLLTALSMKYSYHTGVATYPPVMKDKLSFSNNDLQWDSVKRLGYTVTGSYYSRINNNILSAVYNQLRAGKPVIIGGMKSNGGTHWVIVTGYNGASSTNFNASDFTIIDPNSSTRTNLNQFLGVYPTVLRLVY